MNSAHFDLQREVTHNPQFIAKAEALMKGISFSQRQGQIDKRNAHLKALLRHCEYNPSLLTPYFYPHFNDKNDPMTLWTRPHAMGMMSYTINGSLTIQASRQVGKCVAGTTELDILQDGVPTKMTMEELYKKSRDAYVAPRDSQ